MVHFVGAGPGAKDLISLRGKNHIESADIIIYAGSLINTELLDYAKKDCKLYDSAKLNLEEVTAIYSEFKDSYIVRLHSGDPSIYGAIKEQMLELDSLGIQYDVTPGITAAFGAASSFNFEYTLPGLSQTFMITRISGKTKVEDKEKLSELAKHRASMAIYLSTSLLSEVVDEFLSAGYDILTPVALIYKATWNEEKKFITNFKDLVNVAKSNNITKTALILVGDFISKDFDKSKLYDKHFSTEYRNGI